MCRCSSLLHTTDEETESESFRPDQLTSSFLSVILFFGLSTSHQSTLHPLTCDFVPVIFRGSSRRESIVVKDLKQTQWLRTRLSTTLRLRTTTSLSRRQVRMHIPKQMLHPSSQSHTNALAQSVETRSSVSSNTSRASCPGTSTAQTQPKSPCRK